MKQVQLIPYKQWRVEEGMRCHVCDAAIAMRVARGDYPDLKLVRRNKRVVLVELPAAKAK